MKKLPEILKDLEQGKISADHAESQVLRLFSVSQQREQLAAFYEHLNDIDKSLRHGDGYKEADSFLAASCG